MTLKNLIKTNAAKEGIKDRPFILYEDLRLTHKQFYEESIQYANMLLRLRHRKDVPFHVGVYMENLPEFLKVAGGAALAGAAVVGINTVQRGEFIERDINFCDCQILVTERKYLPELAPLKKDLSYIPETHILVNTFWETQKEPLPFGITLEEALRQTQDEMGDAFFVDPDVDVKDSDLFMIIFTSGTTTAPKGVLNSHGKMVNFGYIACDVLNFTADDVAYAAMPLFHSNSTFLAVMPALINGGGVALIKKFSKSQFIKDVKRYGVTTFNYVGKPLAYILTAEKRPDDHNNSLRIAFGNEASAEHQKEFKERFQCSVVEIFGSTEGGATSIRQENDPPECVGKPPEDIKILNEKGEECPPARFDASGKMLNSEEAVGEIVNTGGLALFEGYYKNLEATQERSLNNQYHTGDLAYKDEQGYMYFAGRDIEWARVDGENFLTYPVEKIINRHPSVFLSSVYGVPDYDAGDQLMVSLLLEEGAEFDPKEFYEFLEKQTNLEMSPKWVPRYVCIRKEFPRTETNKILKRELQKQKFDPDVVKDPIYWRERGDNAFKRFTSNDYEQVKKKFEETGNKHLLDIR